MVFYSQKHKLDTSCKWPRLLNFPIKFCGHEPQQAEQCALIADLVGQCTVKHGCWAQISTMLEFLESVDLKVKMVQDENGMH